MDEKPTSKGLSCGMEKTGAAAGTEDFNASACASATTASTSKDSSDFSSSWTTVSSRSSCREPRVVSIEHEPIVVQSERRRTSKN